MSRFDDPDVQAFLKEMEKAHREHQEEREIEIQLWILRMILEEV